MNKQQGMTIVDGLRKAQAAGAAVVELLGPDARDFAFVKDETTRKELLGSFSITGPKAFFVSVVSRENDDFGFAVYEKRKGQPILASNTLGPGGIVWTYKPTKWTGDNQARKKAFLDAAKAPSITIPLPSNDVGEFSNAVNRAIELRRHADAAGGETDEEDAADASAVLHQLYGNDQERVAAAGALAASIRLAHSINPKSWCVTNPASADLIRLNVGVVRVVDLIPGAVRLAVDGSKLDAAVRASLGSALDLEKERIPSFDDNGSVTVSPSAVASLPNEVRLAHEAFVRRAAPTVSPFGRHHRPEIVEAVAQLVGGPMPTPPALPPRYWKISPGEQGVNWEECRDGGFIGIGWNKLGDISNLSEEEFNVRAEEQGGSDQVWTFRNISIGDRIVANNGTKRVLGIGTVTGTYYFDENGGTHKHRLPVRWDDTTERAVLKKGWFKTLIPIKPDDFSAIENAPPVGSGIEIIAVPEPSKISNTLTFEAILDQLREASLSFSAELVASYLLALQAKRFVLLTGISGTGKTQLALEVARAFDEALVDPASDANGQSTEVFEIIAKPYQLNHGRFVVPSELAQTFDALSDPDTKRIDLKLPGLKKESMAVYKHAERGNLFQVLLSGEAKSWFKANIKLGDRYQLSRQVSGSSEWIELQLSSPGKRTRRAAPAGRTFAAIAVRPNWTDKSEILGFYNPLTNKYQSTKILDFLLRAHAEVEATDGSPRPYFLIFDEMNLARVEHYFSDFLSAMESGQTIDLHDDPQLEDSQGIPRYLTIPKNLFVIGTVNIDETTYMFSPKVLDRAFVLEFNDVNFDGIGQAIDDEAPSSTPLALENFERLETYGKASEQEWQAFEHVLGGELVASLKKLHDALAAEHRHFGYRVAREIARFVNLAVAQTGDEAAARAAFDVAVLAKILPKLHGSQNEVEALLKRLLALAIDDRPEAEVFVSGNIRPEVISDIPLPRSARKLSRMLRRLTARGFVSYIE